jgi:hypothetical protein
LHSRHFLVKAKTEYAKFSPVNAGAPQGSALGPLLYLLYAAVLPTDSVPAIASQKLQTNLAAIQYWFKNKGRIKAKGVQIGEGHIHMKRNVPPRPLVHINNVQLYQVKKSRISGCDLTGDLPGTSTFSQNGNN